MQKAKIVLYTTTVCPYCAKAKALLKNKGVQWEEIDVADQAVRDAMVERAGGRRSVPQIFIGDRHVGGCDDLYALESAGELDRWLTGVSA